jgi:hypothetical protein
MEDWESKDQQNFIIKHLAIQPQEKPNKKKKLKEFYMNDNLKNAIGYASDNKVNEMGAEIAKTLHQKITAELQALKVDIAKNTYNFELPEE